MESRPTLGDPDLPTADRHDYASEYYHWWDEDHQPPPEWGGAEEKEGK